MLLGPGRGGWAGFCDHQSLVCLASPDSRPQSPINILLSSEPKQSSGNAGGGGAAITTYDAILVSKAKWKHDEKMTDDVPAFDHYATSHLRQIS